MKILKKVLSVILIVILCCTSVPLKGFAQNADKMDDLSFESTAPLGAVLSDALEEANSQEDESSASFGVSNVYVENNKVFVDLYTAIDCKIVLAVYNEDTGVMIHTDNLSANTETTELNFDISNLSLPEYYYIKVFMLGENNEPLCTQYEYLYGTRKYQEFFAKTVEDFDEEYVIQLSDDKTNNFLVVNPDSIKIDGADGYNRLTSYNEERGIYTFENIEEEIKNLKEDDVLYFSSDNIDEIVVIKVGSVKVKGDEAVVHQKKTELSDVFQYVKIEAENVADASSYQKAKWGDGVTFYELPTTYSTRDVDIWGDGNLAYKSGFNINYQDDTEMLNVDGSGNISITTDVNIYYDAVLWGKDNIDVSLVTSIDFELSVTLSGKADFVDALYLSFLEDFPVPIVPGVLDGLLGVAPIIEFSLGITTSFVSSYKIGFSYVTGGQFIKIKKGFTEPTFSIEGNLELKLGLQVTLGIELVKSLELNFIGEIGYVLNGTVEFYSEGIIENKTESVVHNCRACLAGKGNMFYAVGVEIEAGWDEVNFTCTVLSRKLEFQLGVWKPFHRSLTDDKYNDTFWGECQNDSFLVTLFLKDKNNNPIEGAWFYMYDVDGYTDANGMGQGYVIRNYGHTEIKIHLPDSEHIIKTSIKVYDEPVTTNIVYNVETGNVEPDNPNNPDNPDEPNNPDNPKDEEKYSYGTNSPTTEEAFSDLFNNREMFTDQTYEGYCGENLIWRVDEFGVLTISGTGPMDSRFSSMLVPTWVSKPIYILEAIVEEGATTIGSHVFGHDYIEKITIPASVVEIGFHGCIGKHTVFIEVDSDNMYYSNDCVGVLYNKEKTRLIDYPRANERTVYYVDANVEEIARDAFSGACINEVYLNHGLKEIGAYAFRCATLEYINIPDTVVSIGAYALNNTYGLKSIHIPNSLKYIGDEAFGNSICTIIYDGTEEQWNKITGGRSVASPNATIIFKNSSEVSSNNISLFSSRAISNKCKIATCNQAVEGESYTMLVVRNKNVNHLLDPYNLLYIDQKVAEDTKLTFEFNLEDPNQEYDVIFVGNKLEHTHSYSVLYQEWPTCNRAGSIVSRCSCGDEQRTEIPALGHYYESVVTSSTCVSSGYTTNTCISCGDSYTSDAIDKLPHSLSNWYTTTLVTCEVDGTEERKCWNCEYTEKKIIPAKGHDFEGSDCKNCNYACNCNCHKGGIAGFFFKLILFFQKIFKQNKYCSGCGIAHY